MLKVNDIVKLRDIHFRIIPWKVIAKDENFLYIQPFIEGELQDVRVTLHMHNLVDIIQLHPIDEVPIQSMDLTNGIIFVLVLRNLI
jgi:hypothetical protein